MKIKRNLYLNKLIRSMHNGMIKVFTGIRRCGRSYLPFSLFSDYLKAQEVDDEYIYNFKCLFSNDYIKSIKYKNRKTTTDEVHFKTTLRINIPQFTHNDELLAVWAQVPIQLEYCRDTKNN